MLRTLMSKTGGRMTTAVLSVLVLLVTACSQPAAPPPEAPPPVASPQAPGPVTPSGDDEVGPPTATPAQPESGGGAPEGARARPGERGAALDVDLRRDEARGGHTIARHVGRSDAQLRARLARESISAASTYPDLETAERVVTQALAANAGRVQRWLDQRDRRSNLAIRYRARDGLPTGRLMRRGADVAEDVTGAVVVLRWRDQAWYVLTSYPEEPR